MKILWLLLFMGSLAHGSFLKSFLQSDQSSQTVFTSLQAKQELLEHLKTELQTYTVGEKEFLDSMQRKLDENDAYTKEVNRDVIQLRDDGCADFFKQKLSLLKEIRQVYVNIQIMRKSIITTLEHHIKLLESYLKDPQFKGMALEPRSFHTIDELRKLTKALLDQESRIKRLNDQRNDAVVEIENHKNKLSVLKKEHKQKQKQKEEFISKTMVPAPEGECKGLDFKQRGQILDLEVALYAARVDLAQLQEKQSRVRSNLLDTQIFIEQQKLQVLESNLTQIKAGLRIFEADVEMAQKELEETKLESMTYLKTIEELSSQREQLERKIGAESEAAVVATAQVDWHIEAETPDAYFQAASLKYQHEQLLLLDRNIELLTAQFDLENAKRYRTTYAIEVMTSWYKITQGKYRGNDEIVREVKHYKDLMAQEQRNLQVLIDKRQAATRMVNEQNRALGVLRKDIEELKKLKNSLFKNAPNLYASSIDILTKAVSLIEQEIEMTNQRIEVYSAMISLMNQTIQDIKILRTELEVGSIWRRSEYAITLQGIKNIVPDVMTFIADVGRLGIAFVIGLRFATIKNFVMRLIHFAGSFFMLLLLLLLLVGLFFLVRDYVLAGLYRALLRTRPEYGAFMIGSRILAVTLDIIRRHLLSIVIWISLFIAVQYGFVDEIFLRIAFYVFSIPYLIYMTRHCIKHVIAFNAAQGEVIFARYFERRFRLIFSLFSYLTIGLLCFREAFIIATIKASEVPMILLAIFSIVPRLLLLIVVAISKDEILSLFPERSPLWQFVMQKIDRYYYLLLVGVAVLMVLSDPYFGGYGNLVSYVLKGVVFTGLLIWLLSILHMFARKFTAYIFFSSEEEDILKARFPAAKTWYGLFTILSFLVLGSIGVIIGMKIWGFPVVWDDIHGLLSKELFPTGVRDGQTHYFTPIDFFAFLGFIIGGFILASAINRFILRRIFDLIPVDLGIQNTIMSITRYVIILLMFLIAFLWVNLSSLLLTIGIVIGSISYIVKEPIGDFFSYFVLLVQRPIQIGDYVRLSEDIEGVVRHITPRSVILRKKNSFSIIVPNSIMITRPIDNWNYARNFVAFDDIIFTIPYTADPEVVRIVAAQVLDSNLKVLKSPAPVIRLDDFSNVGFVFMIRGFITDNNILDKWDIASDIRFEIVKSLRKHGIKIAIPIGEIKLLPKKEDKTS